ncbi:prepilin-type N-terminal cleavage/methylation domain-containing protein [Nocardioides salarius]|uniref:Prepilin-type N-terminal cleavage/methylation domain-containing protein n=1 Tax=Nocardioides salarius TaxID=374513 RepID=A0ABS2M8Q8_9ACTN|nr:type II secretion system protein [Nocardioides salarius]MBM7507568.1 prepilin-type N-terminal cleavage/methylation domain-containing protein [Nocardioides salarius]
MPARPDDGVTMVELVVVIAMMGALMAFAVVGWSAWARASAQDGAASTLEGTLRQAQQQAVSDGWATCVQFDAAADTWTTYEGACGSGGAVLTGPVGLGDGRLDLVDVAFSPTTGGSTAGVTFSARGTATPGRVRIARDGSDRVVTIAVEGLTGRVTTR